MEDESLWTRPQQASQGGAWPDKSWRVVGGGQHCWVPLDPDACWSDSPKVALPIQTA